MEFLIVRFEEDREVVIDDRPQGRTNIVIELEKGTHVIRLATPPEDFTPDGIKIVLENTNVISPKEVRFDKK
jgi:hypothetical protein